MRGGRAGADAGAKGADGANDHPRKAGKTREKMQCITVIAI